MRPSSPRCSRISSTTARYSVASSRVCSSSGWPSRISWTSTRSESPSAGLGAAGDQPAVEADDGGDGTAAAADAGLDHLGEDADAAELAVAARHQEDALLLADVDRQGRGNGREDDRLVERYQPISHNQIHFL